MEKKYSRPLNLFFSTYFVFVSVNVSMAQSAVDGSSLPAQQQKIMQDAKKEFVDAVSKSEQVMENPASDGLDMQDIQSSKPPQNVLDDDVANLLKGSADAQRKPNNPAIIRDLLTGQGPASVNVSGTDDPHYNQGIDNLAQSWSAEHETFVFISIDSMPEDRIVRLFREAISLQDKEGKNPVAFILRGMGKDPAGDEKFLQNLYRLIGLAQPSLPDGSSRSIDNYLVPAIGIDPNIFSGYGITAVPALLHRKNGEFFLSQGVSSIKATISAQEQGMFSGLSELYPIGEPDMETVMHERMESAEFSKSGEELATQEFQEAFNGKIDLPSAVADSKFTVTPTYTIPTDVRDPKTNELLYRNGQIIELLAKNSVAENTKLNLLVVNGQVPEQVSLAKYFATKYPDLVVFYTKLGALADGSLSVGAFPLMDWSKAQFKIELTPTLLVQNGARLDATVFGQESIRQMLEKGAEESSNGQ